MKSLEEIKQIKSTQGRMEATEIRIEELIKRSSQEELAHIEWADIRTQEDWEEEKKKGLTDYVSGKFLIERLGGSRHNFPHLVAVLICLRRDWIREYKITTAPEMILLDYALISYYHYLRINSMLGNFEWAIEREFFTRDSPKAKFCKHYKVEEFWFEESLRRVVEQLEPSLDRFNRMFIRNLKALRDLKRSNQILSIGNVSQLNIGDKQVNVS